MNKGSAISCGRTDRPAVPCLQQSGSPRFLFAIISSGRIPCSVCFTLLRLVLLEGARRLRVVFKKSVPSLVPLGLEHFARRSARETRQQTRPISFWLLFIADTFPFLADDSCWTWLDQFEMVLHLSTFAERITEQFW